MVRALLTREEVSMTLRTGYGVRKKTPLAELERSQREEIAKYKWIESEKAGYDIGWERARGEWLAKHFPAWKRNRWAAAVREALEHDSSLN